jgi:excisionase family DNA binding protein
MSGPLRKAATTPAVEPSGEQETAEVPREDGRIEITVNGVRVEVPASVEAAVRRAIEAYVSRAPREPGRPALEAAVRRAIEAAARPLPKEMTTTQAADYLDVSRPFVIKLVKRGELPCRMVGKHRRIPSDALKAYKENMFQRAREAADEMVRIAEESGLREVDGPPPEVR